MEAIRKVVHSPFGKSSKHQKMSDRWSDYKHRDKVKDGVVFHNMRYLGSILVSELGEEGQSYGDCISADAIKTIVAMSKSSSKKLPMTSLTVSPLGLRVVNMETEEVITDLDIYRICFCTADRAHDKVFAYIARNRDNETMECHAFQCDKRKIAEAVTLTVAESFQIAKELLENNDVSDAMSSDVNVLSASNVDATGHSGNVDTDQLPASPRSTLSSSPPVSSQHVPPPSEPVNVNNSAGSQSDDLMSFTANESINNSRRSFPVNFFN